MIEGDGEASRTHQLLLDGQNAVSCGLTVCLLPCDDDHLRVAVLSRQVDLSVCLLTDLRKLKRKGGGCQTDPDQSDPLDKDLNIFHCL